MQGLSPVGIEVDEIPPAGFSSGDHSVLTVAPLKYAGRQPQAARLAESAANVRDFLVARLSQSANR
ncbi:hypothetical protein [Cellulomonas sp. Leaf334]|uniref:hypothetical protein n=1 Tax=Cellulomonas sp. Leaf334 TaxID=1736339 RepID=UPI0006FBB646|nr:hypothetical protein [Cellulomonas sp. Leaf334]KQR11914.1 hypothetical protein ASF78_11985 [Cellulomonas sp. Leaf334]